MLNFTCILINWQNINIIWQIIKLLSVNFIKWKILIYFTWDNTLIEMHDYFEVEDDI